VLNALRKTGSNPEFLMAFDPDKFLR
jgi:hypothetical protein